MSTINQIYCCYLTTYNGNKLPMFYIGSSSVINIQNGYHGSVKSKKYKSIWKSELKNNPQLFKTKIISYHSTRYEALEKELKLQSKLKVVKSEMCINESLANKNGYFGRNVKGKNHPLYGKPRSNETRLKDSLNHADVSGKNNPMFGRLGENNPKAVSFIAISPTGKCLEGKGIAHFCRQNNLKDSCVSRVLKGKSKQHKGWKFSYT